ncbi:hypothetical protein EDC19_1858 [Natranaerovirga hydrolytica]|uniref:Uncharacterized protein n=1 Tax=Natranaerovirga hydrolytica TaxID=680378 RepID=A0A4R1MS11_9FIRM|nr:hypothetical protein [Natranaerovirga hydrolytica]TCK92703.1 hypothetical protein EDC19_1858 [Natranaerovirga hydrolytica]
MINKKIIAVVTLLMLMFVFVGCDEIENRDTSNNNLEEESPNDSIIDEEENDNDEEEIMLNFDLMVQENEELIEIIEYVDENISDVSKENASFMIEELEALQKNELTLLENEFYTDMAIQSNLMEVFQETLDIEALNESEDENIQPILEALHQKGFKVEIAEGVFYPMMDYNFYNPYSDYVTEDIKNYIEIMVIESNQVPAKDAALMIEWEEVINRALEMEAFINQYKDSNRIQEVEALYNRYVYFLLFGLDNTPLFDYSNNDMIEEVQQVYHTAIETQESSALLDLLEDYLEVIEQNNNQLTDEVVAYRNDVYENMTQR